MNQAMKEQVRAIVMAEIEPLSAVLNQIWADIQAMKADTGEVIPDPPIPDPSIPDPPIPETRVPQTPIDIPPIPGFGPGAKMTEAEAKASDEAAMRERLEQAGLARQAEQASSIARRTSLIEARIAQKLAGIQF
ncbi:hypothetical protein ABWI01_11355 [Oceanicaulis alexandrii]|uniref:hypothetical protein n=1 Tax=Oceanicaulis alexandrii TaxID=153233 RepID=UPI0035CF14BB